MTRLYEAAANLKNITSQAELARALNQSSQTVMNWEKRGISKSGLLKAQALIGCSATWLETGNGTMALSTPSMPPALDEALRAAGAKRVHMSGRDDPTMTQIRKVKLKVRAGVTGFQTEPEDEDGETLGVPTVWVLREGLRKDALISITVTGNSMEPSLHDGDSIVVNTADKDIVSGSVYVVNYEGEAIVKRLLRDVGQWWLVSDNSDQRKYHRQLCKGVECIIVGKVIRKESTHI